MKIASIGLSAPSVRLDNDQLVSLFKSKTSSLSSAESGRYFEVVRKLLLKSGARFRHVRDVDSGETAYTHIVGAARDAIDKAQVSPSNIDLVIYCGVGRGVIEPSNAYYYANELGISSAQCFDIADACMSWTRSLQLCEMYLALNKINCALVITGEFHLNMREPAEVKSLAALSYSFPAYTIGEAATATVLVGGGSGWNFVFDSRPDLFDLCTIPLEGYTTYLRPSAKIGLNGTGKFTSHGDDLARFIGPMLFALAEKHGPSPADVDLYIPHSHSKSAYLDGFKKAGVSVDKIFLEIYENYGNIVSSGVPAGLHTAMASGVAKRGSKICLIPASAGASCACVTFTL